MTFAAAYLRLSLFTHCEQIKVVFPTEKNMRNWVEEKTFQTIVGVIFERIKII
jgi:hypothetical protein